jgi:hypothetical protein
MARRFLQYKRPDVHSHNDRQQTQFPVCRCEQHLSLLVKLPTYDRRPLYLVRDLGPLPRCICEICHHDGNF